MYFIGFDPEGKTLEEVLTEGASYPKGVAVFLLDDEEDEVGKIVDEEFSLRTILKNHPELRTARVVQYNDFFGESVFRVRKESCHESKKN